MNLRERIVCLLWLLALGVGTALFLIGHEHLPREFQRAIRPANACGFLLQLQLFSVIFLVPVLANDSKSVGHSALSALFLTACAAIPVFPSARLGDIDPEQALLLELALGLFGFITLGISSLALRLGKTAVMAWQATLIGAAVFLPLFAYVIAEFSDKPAGGVWRLSPFVRQHEWLQRKSLPDLQVGVLSLSLVAGAIAAAWARKTARPAAERRA